MPSATLGHSPHPPLFMLAIFSEVIIGTYSVSWLNEFSTIADQFHMAGISGLDSIHLVSL